MSDFFLNESGLRIYTLEVQEELNEKVDKETGKGLSTKDFTAEYETMLNDLNNSTINEISIVGNLNSVNDFKIPGRIVTGETFSVSGVDVAAAGNAMIFNLETDINGAYYNKAIGKNSAAFGQGTTASGENSFSEGLGSVAAGAGSHAEGNGGANAIGNGSHAEGIGTRAEGDGSHAEGSGGVRAIGDGSHAEGVGTSAEGVGSHAEGNGGSTAKGAGSHAEGMGSTAHGAQSHAEGSGGTNAYGAGSHAEGAGTIAYGDQSHAEGSGSRAGTMTTNEDGSVTYGGASAHAEGGGTEAAGMSSHAEGGGSKSLGSYCHAEGSGTVAGITPTADNPNPTQPSSAHAEGSGTVASAEASHAEGLNTIAASPAQHVQGKNNIADGTNKFALIVGNGTSNSERSNAFAVDWDGKIYTGNSDVGVDVSCMGDVSNLETMSVIIPVANEYRNTTGGIGGGSITRLDVTNYSKLQIKIETEGTDSLFRLWFGPYGDTNVITEIGANETKFVEIDCSELTGEHEFAFTISNCGRWSDITAHRIIGSNTVDAINATARGIDISDFGEKTKLAENFSIYNLGGYKQVATVSLTGVNALTFTGEIFSVGNASHSIKIAPAGEYPASSSNVIFSDQLISDDWCRKKFKVDVSAYSGDYEIWILGGGAGYHYIRYTDICSFTPIQVNDIADALNHLLSLHN